MKRINHTSFILFFFFIVSFLLFSACPASSLSANDVEREVMRLFERSELIPHVRITPAENDRFVIELIFNIGDRWGRDGFVLALAKAALTSVYTSNLPLAQGIVKIYCAQTEAIHLAIGMNQAKQMSWADNLSPSGFFDMLRSCVHWGKTPEDRTYFIERRHIIKPSPVISLPPGS